MHITNRVRTRSLRTSYRKGFSLLELAAAIAVFGVLSGVVTLAIARAQISATEMRFERQVSGVMQSYVDQVASSSYQSIFTGDFARPAPCNYDYLSTCFSIWGRDVEVSWGTEPLADPLNKSNDGSLAVKIVASAEIKNDILEIEKVVVAPNGAWLGSDGVHRVDVSGEYDGVLYLVNQSGSTVSSGSIVNGSIFFRTSSSLCSSSNPCRVALTPEGSYLYNGYGIDAKSAVGEVGKIVILEGGITSSAVVVKESSQAVIKLSAENEEGFISSPSVKGSVCLWLSFNDGVTDREVARCNTEYADRVIFDDYTPGNDVGIKLGFLNGLSYRVSLDRPSGGCPSVEGSLIHKEGLGWVSGSNCTSYTWGLAESYSIGGVEYSILDSLEYLDNEIELLWSGENASPAAGYGYELRWSKPRATGACSSNNSCQPVTSSLESVACPGEHCYSEAIVAPILTAPVRGEYKVPSIAFSPNTSQSITFSALSVDASSSESTSLSFSSIPVGITAVLYEYNSNNVLVENVITENEVFGSYQGKSGNTSIELRSTAGFGFGILTLLLNGPGGVREVEIAVGNSVFPWSIESSGVSIKQGGASVINVKVVGSNGELFSGADVSAEGLPLGVSASSSVTTSGGAATLLLAATNPLVQSASFSIRAGFSGRSALTSVLLNISPSPGEIVFNNVSVTQGGSVNASALVRDMSGNLLEGAVVSFEVGDGAGLSKNVYAVPSGCVTSGAGSCSVELVATNKSAAGQYSVNISSGSVTVQGSVNVSQRVSKILAKGGSLRQGKFIDIDITLLDGVGALVSGRSITATTGTGLTLSSINPSGSDGKSVLRVSAGLSASIGVRNVVISSGDSSITVPVTIKSRVAAVSTDPVYVKQGGAASVVVELLDPNGVLVDNVEVSLSASTGVTVPEKLRSGVDGKLRFSVLTSSSAPLGDGSFSVSYDGVVIDTVSITVSSIDLRVRSSGVVSSGAGSRSISFTVEKGDGSKIEGKSLVVRSANSNVLINNGSCISSSVGECVVEANFQRKINELYLFFYATVDGNEFAVRVLVK